MMAATKSGSCGPTSYPVPGWKLMLYATVSCRFATKQRQAIAEGRRDTRYPPIFVVGCPRSGTTMLANLLDRTPWGWPFETHFVVKYFRRLANYEPLTERANLVRLARAILAERVGTQWEIDLGRPIDVDQLIDTLAEPTYACLVDALCRRSPDRTAPESWGDKTPQYVLDLDVVTTLFPDSKIILMDVMWRCLCWVETGAPGTWRPAHVTGRLATHLTHWWRNWLRRRNCWSCATRGFCTHHARSWVAYSISWG